MWKLKCLLENVCKWPAKLENCECFLLHEFPIIRYSTMVLQSFQPQGNVATKCK